LSPLMGGGHPMADIEDVPLQLAVTAAAIVVPEWLPGVKAKDAPRHVAEMAATLRRYPDSKPETLWITVQAAAKLKAWDDAPYAVKRAFGVFRAVLLAMDEGLAPEPAKPKPHAGEKMPLRSVFDERPKLADLVRK